MSCGYLPTLAKRMARLEHRNQLLVLLLVATVAVVLVLRFPFYLEGHLFAAPSGKSAAEELLTVRGLRLVDDDGRERAVLRTRDGTAFLEFKGPNGKVRGFLASGEKGGCILRFNDAQGGPRTLVSESSVSVGEGSSYTVLRTLNNSSSLMFIEGGQSRLSLGLSASPWGGKVKDVPEQVDPLIELADASGNKRMLIRTGPVFGPNVILFDESGKVLWQTYFLREDVKKDVGELRKKYEKFLEEISPDELKGLLPQ